MWFVDIDCALAIFSSSVVLLEQPRRDHCEGSAFQKAHFPFQVFDLVEFFRTRLSREVTGFRQRSLSGIMCCLVICL